MKLTAEQKQLLHECIDLGLELTEHNKCAEVAIFIDNDEDPLVNVHDLKGIGDGFASGAVKCFTVDQLQQAKDYSTELLVGKVISKKVLKEWYENDEYEND